MDQDFISAYIRYYQFKKGYYQFKEDENFWAWQKVDALVHDHPDEGWQVVLSLINYMDNEDLLSYVAAGPLEDLLSLHGEKIIAQIEKETKSNPRLRIALSYIWQNTMSDDIWKRIQAESCHALDLLHSKDIKLTDINFTDNTAGSPVFFVVVSYFFTNGDGSTYRLDTGWSFPKTNQKEIDNLKVYLLSLEKDRKNILSFAKDSAEQEKAMPFTLQLNEEFLQKTHRNIRKEIEMEIFV